MESIPSSNQQNEVKSEMKKFVIPNVDREDESALLTISLSNKPRTIEELAGITQIPLEAIQGLIQKYKIPAIPNTDNPSKPKIKPITLITSIPQDDPEKIAKRSLDLWEKIKQANAKKSDNQ